MARYQGSRVDGGNWWEEGGRTTLHQPKTLNDFSPLPGRGRALQPHGGSVMSLQWPTGGAKVGRQVRWPGRNFDWTRRKRKRLLPHKLSKRHKNYPAGAVLHGVAGVKPLNGSSREGHEAGGSGLQLQIAIVWRRGVLLGVGDASVGVWWWASWERKKGVRWPPVA